MIGVTILEKFLELLRLSILKLQLHVLFYRLHRSLEVDWIPSHCQVDLTEDIVEDLGSALFVLHLDLSFDHFLL